MLTMLPEPIAQKQDAAASPTRIISIDVGTRNLALIVVEYDISQATASIKEWKVIDMGSIKGTKSDISKLTLETLCDLDESIINVDHAYIEQQPRINATMVRVSHTIAAYFQLQAIYRGEHIDVSFVPASTKNAYINKRLGLKRTRLYKENKKRAVDAVAQFHLPQPHAETLALSKKKDDLCDCMLQLFAQINVQIIR
jgi:hypothetical protein